MISVAMATYNGEEYIKKQLLSICNQTLKPDEIVICDDCSTDKTLEIISDISTSFSNILWNVCKNETRLGYALNFRKAISLCHGDYIFLSDQDDIWDINKIEVMYSIISNNTKIKLLACTYKCIDEKDNLINSFKYRFNNSISLFCKLIFNKVVKISLKQYLLSRNIPGMAMCFKNDKSLLENFYKITDKALYCHDTVIGMVFASENGLYLLNEPLVNYRLHSKNATGLNNIKDGYKPDRVEWLKYKLNGVSSILRCAIEIGEEKAISYLLVEKKLSDYRIELLSKKEFPSIYNINNYNSILAYINDIRYCINKKC